ncbi:hypothetical protein M1512_02750 [Patescibacteria group bacterium]|jgi:type I restriction enzyme R subunit|nr:hypothetical protein [Patescibacteria group bacterium]
MVEHFRPQIELLIEGKAQAMIVTKSRLHAVRHYRAVRDYLAKQGYAERAIVAFSGTVIDARSGDIEYTEAGKEPSRARRASVHFSPSARTAWR